MICAIKHAKKHKQVVTLKGLRNLCVAFTKTLTFWIIDIVITHRPNLKCCHYIICNRIAHFITMLAKLNIPAYINLWWHSGLKRGQQMHKSGTLRFRTKQKSSCNCPFYHMLGFRSCILSWVEKMVGVGARGISCQMCNKIKSSWWPDTSIKGCLKATVVLIQSLFPPQ